MGENSSRYGLFVSALGAIVLAVSVFLPWYGVSLTAGGVAVVQQTETQLASRYGNAALQAEVGGLHTSLSGLADHQFVALSAHQILKNLNVVLLLIAAVAVLATLMMLAREGPSSLGESATPIALLGAVAALCVGYRMVQPPNPASAILSLSLREGAWLALLGSLAMLVGGLWPRSPGFSIGTPSKSEPAWSDLSGWTPEG